MGYWYINNKLSRGKMYFAKQNLLTIFILHSKIIDDDKVAIDKC